MSRGAIQQYEMYGLMPIGDTVRSGINWWQHTDIATKKHWFGEPWGGPDTELARPFYVANHEKKMAEVARAAADPQARMTDLIGTTKSREQQVPIIDALVNNHGGFFQVNVPNKGAFAGVADDVVVEVPAWIDRTGHQPAARDAAAEEDHAGAHPAAHPGDGARVGGVQDRRPDDAALQRADGLADQVL